MKNKKYKIAIWILSSIVAIQGMIIFFLGRMKIPPKVMPPVLKGKIAIVLDDWGYNLNTLSLLDGLNYPLTMAVLPNLAHSVQVAQDLHGRGFEVILHLPLEPRENHRLEQNTILTSMDEQKIISILTQDLTGLAHLRGVSNHMGSRATADSRAMQIIFKELKKRRLYFLDNLVSRDSVCANLAKQLKLNFLQRDIFLDGQENPAYIKRQIYKLKIKAKTSGQAIGVGHNRKITLQVLKEMLPLLEKEGLRLVYLSELVK